MSCKSSMLTKSAAMTLQERAVLLDGRYPKAIRIRNKCLAEIVKGVFKFVVLVYEDKAFSSLEAVCRNVADALSMET